MLRVAFSICGLYLLAVSLIFAQPAQPALPESWIAHVKTLEQIRNHTPSDALFVKKLFHYVHRHILNDFTEEISFNQTIATGNYNCLTATTTFALLLDHFNIRHQIVETTYHIFIIAKLQDNEWLIETTDPLHGLIRKDQVISQRLENYRKIVPQQNGYTGYLFKKDIFNVTSLTGLRGLDFYNQAVYAFNRKDMKQSVYLLQQASVYYHSPRIHELADLLWLSIRESELSDVLKFELTKRLAIVRNLSSPLLASSAP
ncbi:MAG: hypothetical protein RMK43_05830 [Cyclobacteriaceae bacterium]|nr:hypothetical protein [Cyclobacteriaceae bacterium]